MNPGAMEVLFCASSEEDGVQSRGAGWHSRRVPGRTSVQRLAALTGELVKGDLAKASGETVKLYVQGDHKLLIVRSLRPFASHHESSGWRETARRFRGDWFSFWMTYRSAGELLWIVPDDVATRNLLTASACDLAETVLRFIPSGEERPARALRGTRRWLAGAVPIEEVRLLNSAAHAASRAAAASAVDSREAATSAVAYASASAVVAACVSPNVSDAADAAADAADASVEASRSLVFLVRVRIPFWRVCLAVTEGARA